MAYVKKVCDRNRVFVGVGFPNPHDEPLRQSHKSSLIS